MFDIDTGLAEVNRHLKQGWAFWKSYEADALNETQRIDCMVISDLVKRGYRSDTLPKNTAHGDEVFEAAKKLFEDKAHAARQAGVGVYRQVDRGALSDFPGRVLLATVAATPPDRWFEDALPERDDTGDTGPVVARLRELLAEMGNELDKLGG